MLSPADNTTPDDLLCEGPCASDPCRCHELPRCAECCDPVQYDDDENIYDPIHCAWLHAGCHDLRELRRYHAIRRAVGS